MRAVLAQHHATAVRYPAPPLHRNHRSPLPPATAAPGPPLRSRTSLHLACDQASCWGRRRCDSGAMTPGLSSAGSLPGMQSAARRSRWISQPMRKRH